MSSSLRYISWSGNKNSTNYAVPASLAKLWENNNVTGTGVFIPQAVKSRRDYSPSKHSNPFLISLVFSQKEERKKKRISFNFNSSVTNFWLVSDMNDERQEKNLQASRELEKALMSTSMPTSNNVTAPFKTEQITEWANILQ